MFSNVREQIKTLTRVKRPKDLESFYNLPQDQQHMKKIQEKKMEANLFVLIYILSIYISAYYTGKYFVFTVQRHSYPFACLAVFGIFALLVFYIFNDPISQTTRAALPSALHCHHKYQNSRPCRNISTTDQWF